MWLVIGAVTAPIWGVLLYALWQGLIRPRLIPSEDIERLAGELLKRHGDRAANVAFADEFHAWRHSNGFERDKWRRVRWHIERRHN